MTLRTPSRRCGVSAAVILLLAEGLAAAALAEPQVVAELQADLDYQGAVHSIAFDESGDAWMATGQTLYKVQGGRAQVIDVAPGRYDQITLAPGGGIYARLVAGGVPAGLFTVELVKIPREPIAELRLPDSPYGFGAIYLGGAGDLIVTVTPLDDSEGLGGRFRYVFWSREGRMLSETTLDGRRTAVVDVAGHALLLLGEKDALALSNEGQQLWKLDGAFRKGALAAKGTIALLNPANAIDEVHVVRKGNATPIKMRSPVYDLALAANGSVGAVAINEGELSFVSPGTCERSSCKLRPVSALFLDGRTFLISAIRFVDQATLAVGMIQRVGEASPFSWPSAAALVVNTSGGVMFRTSIKLEQPATWAPFIDVSYGARFFAAHTPHRALFVRLDR